MLILQNITFFSHQHKHPMEHIREFVFSKSHLFRSRGGRDLPSVHTERCSSEHSGWAETSSMEVVLSKPASKDRGPNNTNASLKPRWKEMSSCTNDNHLADALRNALVSRRNPIVGESRSDTSSVSSTASSGDFQCDTSRVDGALPDTSSEAPKPEFHEVTTSRPEAAILEDNNAADGHVEENTRSPRRKSFELKPPPVTLMDMGIESYCPNEFELRDAEKLIEALQQWKHQEPICTSRAHHQRKHKLWKLVSRRAKAMARQLKGLFRRRR